MYVDNDFWFISTTKYILYLLHADNDFSGYVVCRNPPVHPQWRIQEFPNGGGGGGPTNYKHIKL